MKKFWVSAMVCAFMMTSVGIVAQTADKPAEKEKKEAPAKKPMHKNHKAPMKKECEKAMGDKKECVKKEGEKKAGEMKKEVKAVKKDAVKKANEKVAP